MLDIDVADVHSVKRQVRLVALLPPRQMAWRREVALMMIDAVLDALDRIDPE